MSKGAGAALRTQLATLRAVRSPKFLLYGLMTFLFIMVAFFLSGALGESDIAEIRAWVLLPGIPIAAVIAAEIPLRDGISRRTLLYPLLGPTSRGTLAIVRTLVSSTILAVVVVGLVAALGVLGQANIEIILRESAAAALAAFAYSGLFGLLHMLTKRGLITGLMIYAVLDWPIGRLPFDVRNVMPSAHVRSVAALPFESDLPVAVYVGETPLLVGTVYLLVVGLATILLTAGLFARRDLGELC